MCQPQPALVVSHCFASSTLNGDEDTFGVQFVIDGREDTCWNSDGSAESTLQFTLSHCSAVGAVEIIFQGGFVGKEMRISGFATEACGGVPQLLGAFQPEDCNERQRFSLPAGGPLVKVLQLYFSGSSDFYGRIVIYAVQVFP